MKIYNESGDFLGEFTEAVTGGTTNLKISWFGIGMFLAIIGLFISPFWAILAIIALLFLKFFTLLLKLLFNCVWWILKLPFCLLFMRRLPRF